MAIKIEDLVRREILSIDPYIPPKPIAEIKKELNIKELTILVSNENTLSVSKEIIHAIIDELENARRGPYAGAVGYFSFSGNMDTCINIRTILVKGRNAYIQAGAGIVSDSVPAKEYQETANKAKAMIKAIELAEKGLE